MLQKIFDTDMKDRPCFNNEIVRHSYDSLFNLTEGATRTERQQRMRADNLMQTINFIRQFLNSPSDRCEFHDFYSLLSHIFFLQFDWVRATPQ